MLRPRTITEISAGILTWRFRHTKPVYPLSLNDIEFFMVRSTKASEYVRRFLDFNHIQISSNMNTSFHKACHDQKITDPYLLALSQDNPLTYAGGEWGVPKGHHDSKKDNSYYQTAKREFNEECNLHISPPIIKIGEFWDDWIEDKKIHLYCDFFDNLAWIDGKLIPFDDNNYDIRYFCSPFEYKLNKKLTVNIPELDYGCFLNYQQCQHVLPKHSFYITAIHKLLTALNNDRNLFLKFIKN